MVLHSIDYKNIIRHPLIKATEYSSVHGGTLIKPGPSSASSIHSTTSVSSTTSSNSSSPATASSPSLEASYIPVVLKWSRHPDDFKELLFAHSKIRDNAPNIVPFYGATREPPTFSAEEPSSTSAEPSTSSRLALSTSPTITFKRTRASSGLERVQAPAQPTSSSLPKSSTNSSITSFQLPEPDETQPRDWIVTKPAAHGTLHEFLKSPQGEALSWMDKIRLIRGIASGLKYLHDHELLHMHLHSDNVLVENGPTALLTDFGQYARSMRGPEETLPGSPRWVSSGGTYEKNLLYTAPERILNPQQNPCTPATDVYSLGVIMLEIMVGNRSLASQFIKSSSPDTRWNLETTTPWTAQNGSRPSQMAMQLPSAMEGLIRKMLSRDPTQRPGLMAIRSQLKEMANTSFDLHVREPIGKGTTSIQLNPKKPISVITTPLVLVESGTASAAPSSAGSMVSLAQDSHSQPQSPKSPNTVKKRTSFLRRALDMSLASPPASPKRKQTTIWEAAAKGDIKAIHALLAQGISINQRDPLTDHTPLLAAVADLDSPTAMPSIAVLELLINRGAEINAVDHKTKQTALHHLCARPNPSPVVMRFLLERGANPNAVSTSRQTPLHYLAEKAKTTSPLELMRLLLDFGADVNAKGPVMWTALHLLSASEKPFLDVIMLLLTRDVNVNARDSNQWTALHFVAHYNQDPAPALKMLVDAGADVNLLTKRGEDLVQVLLKSKSIDRLAIESFVGSGNASACQNGSANNVQSSMTGNTGLGLTLGGSTGALAPGGHRRNRSSLSTVSNASFGSVSMAPSLVSTAEAIMAPSSSSSSALANDAGSSGAPASPAFSTTTILSPEEEAKEESLKKLADLIRWLIVDCGLDLDRNFAGSEDKFEEEESLMHPKSRHPLIRAVRLGMRPIVSVLLETSLAMSETVVLDCAIRVTEEMMASLLGAGPLGSSVTASVGVAPPAVPAYLQDEASSSGNSTRPSRQQYHHRTQAGSIASIGSIGSLGSLQSLVSTTSSSTAGTSTSTAATGVVVTPKTVAAANAAAARIREIEMLLRIWRSEEGTQREELRAGVASRLQAAAAQRTLVVADGVGEAYGSGGHSRRDTGALGRSRTNAAGRTKLDHQHLQQQHHQQQQQQQQGRPIRRPGRDAGGHPVDLSSSYGSIQDNTDEGCNISVVSVEHEITGLLPGMRSVTM